MRIALALLISIGLMGATPRAWLDSAVPAGWNVAGAAIPRAPGPPDAELEPGGRCANTARRAATAEDRAVARKGWTPIVAYQNSTGAHLTMRKGPVALVLATSGADGMCRPTGYQLFAFFNGAYAGTLAPKPMDARTDGALLGATITGPAALRVEFLRYADADPLCCPHGATRVTYSVRSRAAGPVAVPVSAGTTTLKI